MEPKFPGCNCSVCPFKDREFVPPEGPKDSEVLFLGQAPARNEVREGRPFAGQAGVCLNAALEESSLERGKILIDNVILCFFAGGERPPREAVECCRGHIDLETPRVIVPLGNDALGVVTNRWDGIMSLSGEAFGSPEKVVIPLVHPAFYLRNNMPESFTDFVQGVSLVRDFLEGRSYFHVGSRFRVLRSREEALALFESLRSSPPRDLAVDLEASGPDPFGDIILCVALAWDEEEGVVIPWDSEYLRQHNSEFVGLLEDEEVFRSLKSCLELQPGVLAHNSLYDACMLKREGIDVRVVNDTLLMHYVLDERRGVQGLKNIARRFLGLSDWEVGLKDYLPNKEAPFTLVPPGVLFEYAAKDACVELVLRRKLGQVLDTPENAGPKRLYTGAGEQAGLMDICRMFVDVISRGVRMDPEALSVALKEMPSRLEELSESLRQYTGSEFYNPGSVPDNRYYLFEKFGLPKVKGDSTDKEVLETLRGEHPFVDLLLEYRQYQKVCNTYMVNIARSYRSGRGHPDFKLFGTVTGRLSANNLNPLVFPRESRGDLYSYPKRVFVADDGCFLLQADYKGMELRVLAVLSQDPWALEVLSNPESDWHGEMAEEMYGELYTGADEKLKKELRVIAKMLVFGLNYGRGAPSIARQLRCSAFRENPEFCPRCRAGLDCLRALREADDLIERYFSPIPVIKHWRTEQVRLAHTVGYIESPFGRRRRFPLITASNKHAVDKQALNTAVQSTASDCTLQAMYRLYSEVGDLVRPLWTVHDAVLMNVSLRATPRDVEGILSIIEETPRVLLDTDLPFFLDASAGFRWGALTPYEGVIPELADLTLLPSAD